MCILAFYCPVEDGLKSRKGQLVFCDKIHQIEFCNKLWSWVAIRLGMGNNLSVINLIGKCVCVGGSGAMDVSGGNTEGPWETDSVNNVSSLLSCSIVTSTLLGGVWKREIVFDG